jgi:GNAT superfamily N-acetyltransferase
VEIGFFGVTPDLVGAGFGSSLMAFAIDRAWDASPARVFLRTCTYDHPRALPFYLKVGFRAYKRAIEIADDPRLTGVLPVSAAPDVPIIGSW